MISSESQPRINSLLLCYTAIIWLKYQTIQRCCSFDVFTYTLGWTVCPIACSTRVVRWFSSAQLWQSDSAWTVLVKTRIQIDAPEPEIVFFVPHIPLRFSYKNCLRKPSYTFYTLFPCIIIHSVIISCFSEFSFGEIVNLWLHFHCCCDVHHVLITRTSSGTKRRA